MKMIRVISALLFLTFIMRPIPLLLLTCLKMLQQWSRPWTHKILDILYFGISNVSVVSKAEPLFWGQNHFYFKGSMCNTYLQFPSKPWRGSKRPCSDSARRNYDPKRKIGGRSPARFGGGYLRRRVQFFARHRNKSRPFIRFVRQTENRKWIQIRCRRIFAGQSATWT